jgi:hypothetical protein
MCIGLHVFFILVRFYRNLNFLDRFSKKYLHTKFHENPFSGSRVVSCGRSDGLTELIVAFRNFANACKNGVSKCGSNENEHNNCCCEGME